MLTLTTLSAILNRLAERSQFLIAYSGGIDSHVLLQSVARLREQNTAIQLRAIHIHHGLHNDADQWTEHCQTICDQLQIELLIKKIQVCSNNKEGIEAAARHARYRAIQAVLKQEENLLTAHHQNDQAETVLLQLLRGAGPQGLAAMPEKAIFHPGYHLRPLLNFTREQLYEYAQSNQLQWLEDPSNAETSFNRNYLRHNVVPLLEQRWPSMAAVVSRSAQNCALAVEILNETAMYDLQVVQQNDHLSISQLLTLSQARRFNVLRYWLQKRHLPLPSRNKLEQIDKEVLLSREDAMPLVTWQTVAIRRYRDGLYVTPSSLSAPTQQIIPWDLTAPLVLPDDLGRLTVENLAKQGICLPSGSNITVRFRQGGEKIKIKGRQGTQSLKKLMQEWGIPPWQRHQVPLLYCGNKLAAVMDYCVAEEFTK